MPTKKSGSGPSRRVGDFDWDRNTAAQRRAVQEMLAPKQTLQAAKEYADPAVFTNLRDDNSATSMSDIFAFYRYQYPVEWFRRQQHYVNALLENKPVNEPRESQVLWALALMAAVHEGLFFFNVNPILLNSRVPSLRPMLETVYDFEYGKDLRAEATAAVLSKHQRKTYKHAGGYITTYGDSSVALPFTIGPILGNLIPYLKNERTHTEHSWRYASYTLEDVHREYMRDLTLHVPWMTGGDVLRNKPLKLNGAVDMALEESLVEFGARGEVYKRAAGNYRFLASSAQTQPQWKMHFYTLQDVISAAGEIDKFPASAVALATYTFSDGFDDGYYDSYARWFATLPVAETVQSVNFAWGDFLAAGGPVTLAWRYLTSSERKTGLPSDTPGYRKGDAWIIDFAQVYISHDDYQGLLTTKSVSDFFGPGGLGDALVKIIGAVVNLVTGQYAAFFVGIIEAVKEKITRIQTYNLPPDKIFLHLPGMFLRDLSTPLSRGTGRARTADTSNRMLALGVGSGSTTTVMEHVIQRVGEIQTRVQAVAPAYVPSDSAAATPRTNIVSTKMPEVLRLTRKTPTGHSTWWYIVVGGVTILASAAVYKAVKTTPAGRKVLAPVERRVAPYAAKVSRKLRPAKASVQKAVRRLKVKVV